MLKGTVADRCHFLVLQKITNGKVFPSLITSGELFPPVITCGKSFPSVIISGKLFPSVIASGRPFVYVITSGKSFPPVIKSRSTVISTTTFVFSAFYIRVHLASVTYFVTHVKIKTRWLTATATSINKPSGTTSIAVFTRLVIL